MITRFPRHMSFLGSSSASHKERNALQTGVLIKGFRVPLEAKEAAGVCRRSGWHFG